MDSHVISWLSKKAEVKAGSKLSTSEVYFAYKEDCCVHGREAMKEYSFGKYVHGYFGEDIKVKKEHVPGLVNKSNKYLNLSWKRIHYDQILFSELPRFIQDIWCNLVYIINVSDNSITAEMQSGMIINNIDVRKTVVFTSDLQWKLFIGIVQVDLEMMKIDPTFELNQQCISSIIDIIQKINLCSGKVKPAVANIQSLYVEHVKYKDCVRKVLRSRFCDRVRRFTQKNSQCCTVCQKITQQNQSKSKDDENK